MRDEEDINTPPENAGNENAAVNPQKRFSGSGCLLALVIAFMVIVAIVLVAMMFYPAYL